MNPTLNGSLAIRCFEGGEAIEIRDGISTRDCHMCHWGQINVLTFEPTLGGAVYSPAMTDFTFMVKVRHRCSVS